MPHIVHTRPAHYLLLLIVTAVLTLPGLGSLSFWDIDEGLNAEAAREMLESGDWVVPTFNFKPRTAKPALLYWLQALCYERFGVNEFSARLPSVLAGAAAVLLTYELGRRMFGAGTGLLAGVITISTLQVCVLVHAATPDALLLACMLLTFLLFWTGAENGRRVWPWTIGLGCGLGVLAKGPVAIVMPVAIIGYYFLARRQFRRLFDSRLLASLAIVVLIAGPWYALVGAGTRGQFLKSFWHTENVGRFLAPMEGHAGPAYFYPAAMLVGLGAWAVVVLPAIGDALRSVRRDDPTDEQSDAVRFLLCWSAVYVGFFSLAQTKLPNYVLPAYPPVAILIARFLERWRRGEIAVPGWIMGLSLASLATIGLAIGIAYLIVGGAVAPKLVGEQRIAGLAPWAWVGLIPIVGTIIVFNSLRQGRRLRFVTGLATTAVAFIGVGIVLPVAVVDARKAPRPLVLAAGVCRTADEVRIASLEYFQPSLVFYCRREVTELFTERQALDLLRSPLPAYVFCPARVGDLLVGRGNGVCRVAARHSDFLRGTDVVVVTNQN